MQKNQGRDNGLWNAAKCIARISNDMGVGRSMCVTLAYLGIVVVVGVTRIPGSRWSVADAWFTPVALAAAACMQPCRVRNRIQKV